MSNLTGQQINQTYPGLLNLQDSTTGITTNLQSIQDGLGNDTGLRIKQNQFEAPNIQTFIPLKGQYYGAGFTAAAVSQMAAGTQNIILAYPFYDSGDYAYSAMSYNIVTASTSSDTCQASIYSSQYIDGYGLYPHEVIISGLTIATTPVGIQTVTFPSNISFSGYGGGLYWVVIKISNGGVQPTIRYGATSLTNISNIISWIYGYSLGLQSGTYSSPIRLNGNFQAFTGTTAFANPFPSTLPTTQSTAGTVNGTNLGMILHTVR